jgi:hypothetical protein
LVSLILTSYNCARCAPLSACHPPSRRHQRKPSYRHSQRIALLLCNNRITMQLKRGSLLEDDGKGGEGRIGPGEQGRSTRISTVCPDHASVEKKAWLHHRTAGRRMQLLTAACYMGPFVAVSRKINSLNLAHANSDRTGPI